MTCFCASTHAAQIILIVLAWLGCLAEIALLVFRASHRHAKWRTVADTALLLILLGLMRFMVGYHRGISHTDIHLPYLALAAAIVVVHLYTGVSLHREYRRSKQEINEWSVKEAVDDLPVGLCFADDDGHIILCNRKMDALSHQLTGRHAQILDNLTAALADPPRGCGVTALTDVSDCYRFPDGKVYRFRRSELYGEELRGYTQLAAYDETELYDGTLRLRASNAELEEVNQKLQKMYERMADDVREQESLDLKVWLHDTLGSSLLTVTDVKNSSSLEVQQKLERLREAVGTLSASRPTIQGTVADAKRKAAQMGVKVTLTGYIPPETTAERLVAAAIRECVTNCIRHAKGSEVHVAVTERHGYLRAEITNNGEVPAGPITEGSGLSSLRRSVEASGGEMHISHRPAFSLTLYLSTKEELL